VKNDFTLSPNLKTKLIKMKAILITLISLLVITTGYSQVSESQKDLSFGSKNAFVIDHEGAEHKDVYKMFEKKFKEYGKVERNKKAKEWSCLQCNIPSIGSNLNIYFKVDEGKGQVTSYTFVDNGEEFISSDSDSGMAAKVESFLTSLSHDVERETTSKVLEDDEDTLKDRTKELSKLEKKNADLHKDIENYKKKIMEAEENIEKNLQAQEDKKMEIEKQKKVVEMTTEKLNAIGRN